MKKVIMVLMIILMFFVMVSSGSQNKKEEIFTIYTVMYFGATSCGPCNRPETIKAVQRIPEKMAQANGFQSVKHVIVCMDKKLSEALNFIKKYPNWDEFSMGSFYMNELALANLNQTKIPGVPHIMVYRDQLYDKSLPKIKNRKLIFEIFGGKSIVKWGEGGFKIK